LRKDAFAQATVKPELAMSNFCTTVELDNANKIKSFKGHNVSQHDLVSAQGGHDRLFN